MHRHPLTDHWTLSLARPSSQAPTADLPDTIPATVPGCVHTDLLTAGLINDPFYDRNELEVQWIGDSDWTYQCTFDAESDLLSAPRCELACAGLDTVATVTLNGTQIGTAANMHLTHRFDASHALQEGSNTLEIRFDSAIQYAQAMEERLGPRPHINRYPFNFIRKMACNFGWDWGPILVTAGIWKPITLEAWSVVRLAAVRPLVTQAEPDRATVDVHVDLTWGHHGDEPITLEFALAGPDGRPVAAAHQDVAPGMTRATLQLDVDDPSRWWPVGYGDQPLYTLSVKALRRGDALDAWSSRIGLRTVELDTTPDAEGSAFTVKVNDTPVLCKGANWIPDDVFVSRVERADYRERLSQAVQANMNMVRVWGGGLYETDAFYDCCDELGLLVWQDFPFSCALYPEEAPFPALIEAEARDNISRLAPHPSLALWNGNNEAIWGYFDWERDGVTWRHAAKDRTWGQGYYQDLLPRLVGELDPSRPYWPGSPYSGTMDRSPNDPGFGCTHVWEAWFGSDYTRYRAYTPRFASEFGHQAAPTFATLAAALPDDQRAVDAPGLQHHQRSPTGQERLQDLLGKHFRAPNNFDDWIFATQLNQVRALRTGIDWFRSRHPVCQGMLYWQLNDCWPVLSWSAVDGPGRPKLLWYATRRFFRGRRLSIQPATDAAGSDAAADTDRPVGVEPGSLRLYAYNDTDAPWETTPLVRRVGLDGQVHARDTMTLSVPPRAVRSVPLTDPFAPRSPQAECLLADRLTGNRSDEDSAHRADDLAHNSNETARIAQRASWFFVRDKHLTYSPPQVDVSVDGQLDHAAPDATMQARVTLTARTLIRDACLLLNRLEPEATVSDQLFTLLPGESVTLTVHSPDAAAPDRVTPEALSAPPVFQCANRFGASPTF